MENGGFKLESGLLYIVMFRNDRMHSFIQQSNLGIKSSGTLLLLAALQCIVQ